ncbi:MAG: hypothetical protein VYA34_00755 [Myxococcota bacterium]|nr:hypothetical protein [Myxococcota bacterium]
MSDLHDSENQSNDYPAIPGQMNLLDKISPYRHRSVDDLNLIELPISLLSNSNQGLARMKLERDPGGMLRIPLSPDSTRFLLVPSAEAVPTALGERVLLALLWMHNDLYQFATPEITFDVNMFLSTYLYPNVKTRISQSQRDAVLQELEWFSSMRLGAVDFFQRVIRDVGSEEVVMRNPQNAAIFEQFQIHARRRDAEPAKQSKRGARRVVYERKGGPIRVTIRWGETVYRSLAKDKLTKRLNPLILLEAKNPLDLRLYRWLDKHFYKIDEIFVDSIINFARYKMFMQAQKLHQSPKTASKYAMTKIEQSLERLRGLNYPVSIEANTRFDDYRITFKKLDISQKDPSSVVEAKLTESDDLFLLSFFTKLRFGDAAPDRPIYNTKEKQLAKKFLATYKTLAYAKEIVQECFGIIKRAKGTTEHVKAFTYLTYFANDAEANLKKSKRRQKPKEKTNPLDAWDIYRENQLEQAKRAMASNEQDEMRDDIARELTQDVQFGKHNEKTKQALITAALEDELLRRLGAMDEQEFLATL